MIIELGEELWSTVWCFTLDQFALLEVRNQWCWQNWWLLRWDFWHRICMVLALFLYCNFSNQHVPFESGWTPPFIKVVLILPRFVSPSLSHCMTIVSPLFGWWDVIMVRKKANQKLLISPNFMEHVEPWYFMILTYSLHFPSQIPNFQYMFIKFHGLKMFEATFCHLLPMFSRPRRPSPWAQSSRATFPHLAARSRGNAAGWLVVCVTSVYYIYN